MVKVLIVEDMDITREDIIGLIQCNSMDLSYCRLPEMEK